MTTIQIKDNINRVQKQLSDIAKKQVPYATRLTLNALTTTAKIETEKQIASRLDRPTPYAKNMMRVKYANKTNLTSQLKVKDTATVTKAGFRGPDKILGHLFLGGSRSGKGFEGLMVRAGVMPAGYWAVAGEGAPLDSYGNIERSLIIKLLAYFRAFRESGYRANSTDKSRAAMNRKFAKGIKGATTSEFFVSKIGDKLPFGIWQRIGFQSGTAIRPIIIFVKKTPQYKQYFDLETTTNNVVNRDLRAEFDKALTLALATAK